MAKYSIKAPDGNTYSVEGPEGATDEQVRAEVIRQNPGLGNAAPTGTSGYQAKLSDVARSLEQGATAHWAPSINAAVQPRGYDENVQTERAKQQAFAQNNPGSDIGLQVLGGAGTGAALAKGTQALAQHLHGKAGAVADAIAALERLIPKSFTGKAALAGGASGAVAGAGDAPTVGDIPKQAGEQGVLGAILGPLSALGAKYGTQGPMAMVDKLRGLSMTPGVRRVLTAMNEDQDTTGTVAARLKAAERTGVPTTIADVGGNRTQALAAVAAGKATPGATQATQALAERNAGASDRVTDLINKHLTPDDYTTKLEELTSNLYKDAKPLYDTAYAAHPSVGSKAIFDILGTPSGRKAGMQAAKMMQDVGIPIGKADAAGMISKPSLQYLDFVKRALDDQISTAERTGASSQGRILREMRNNLRDELDATAPEYKAARGQYAGDLEVRDALTNGREGFGRMTPQQVQAAMANMSYAEKDAFRSGVAESLFQKVGNVKVGQNPAEALLNTPNMGQRLQALFDKPGDYKQFRSALEQEMQNFQRARVQIAANRSGHISAAEASMLGPRFGEAAYEGTLGALGHPVWAGARGARWALDKLMTSPKAADQASEALSSSGKPAQDFLGQLKQQEAALSRRLGVSKVAGLSAVPGVSESVGSDIGGP